jgi:hypothetical protein
MTNDGCQVMAKAHIGELKKDKRTNSDLQNIAQKTNNRAKEGKERKRQQKNRSINMIL